MKIVRIIGGLGNQMFQYALFLSLRERFRSEDIYVDTSYFNSYKLHNGLELERIFNISLQQPTFRQMLRLTWPVYFYKVSRAIQLLLPHRPTECFERTNCAFESAVYSDKDMYYWGYWQNERYFENCIDIIRKTYSFSDFDIHDSQNYKLAELLNDGEYISIHVRRGDYLSHPLYKDTCPSSYYKDAVAYIRKNRNIKGLVIFSNDIEWCRNNLSDIISDNDIFVDWNKGSESYKDMQLMSLCKHNIIANSSFSWWGAWLNNYPEKLVVAPKKWLNIPLENTPVCPDWIKL